ncbi:MAG: hypothetical protein M1837_003876 [Sclerophora amabilis]|nr:MAG: hypothetical protein M1837_003876 [Sclerophora amabilis]
MPRLPCSLLKSARSEEFLLPLLLRVCRSLPSARNELRWLRERAVAVASQKAPTDPKQWRPIFRHLCELRSRGRPLQYILGDQPFGDLDILCKPGVLIPRPETEAYTTHLAKLLVHNLLSNGRRADQSPLSLRILDLCTGTGCIPLLLHSLLSSHIEDFTCVGIDISPLALSLARCNLRWNVQRGKLMARAQKDIQFLQADVLANSHATPNDANSLQTLLRALPQSENPPQFGILISNPPYISPRDFNTTTSRSVRNWEPKLALVPPNVCSESGRSPDPASTDPALLIEDTFYPHLLATATAVNAKVLVLEVSDLAQALRVAALAQKNGDWDGIEIWRDWPSGHVSQGPTREVKAMVGGQNICIVGRGNGRAVVCWKGDGGSWLGKT